MFSPLCRWNRHHGWVDGGSFGSANPRICTKRTKGKNVHQTRSISIFNCCRHQHRKRIPGTEHLCREECLLRRRHPGSQEVRSRRHIQVELVEVLFQQTNCICLFYRITLYCNCIASLTVYCIINQVLYH